MKTAFFRNVRIEMEKLAFGINGKQFQIKVYFKNKTLVSYTNHAYVFDDLDDEEYKEKKQEAIKYCLKEVKQNGFIFKKN